MKAIPWAFGVVVFNVIAIANIPRSVFNQRYGQAFVSSCLNIACLVFLFCVSLFPNLVVSTSEFDSLTIYNAASSQGTLWLMLIIAMIGAPLVISYTVIIYWTFRQRIDLES